MDEADIKTLCLRLEQAGVDHPRRDLDRLLAHCNGDDVLFQTLFARRLKREPLERIFGEANFYGLNFRVIPSVFKPGFETETTMEFGLLHLQNRDGPLRILDLGTGTGCILLTLLHHVPQSTGLGVDLNLRALEIAAENAVRHSLSDRAEFRHGDWLDGVEGPFDLVISNPPRIPSQAIPHLVREVSLYDPKDALDGGDSGLEFYRRTAKDFRRVAAPGALGVLQVGGIVAADALALFHHEGYNSAVIRRDYKMSPNALVFSPDPVKRNWLQRLFG